MSHADGSPSCTLTLIGASTAVSSAHCFHDGDNWLPNKAWSFGANSRATVRHPFNPWGSYPSTNPNNPPVFQCYWVIIPGCWDGDGTRDCDYAVVEFSNNGGAYPNCNLSPGNTLGWVGWGTQSSSTIQNSQHEFKGYPVNTYSWCDGLFYGGCGSGGANCEWQLLWGDIMGPFTVGPAGQTYQLSHQFDANGGQSGAVLINHAEGFPKAVGIHWGAKCNDPNRNWAVRINSPVINFIKAYTPL